MISFLTVHTAQQLPLTGRVLLRVDLILLDSVFTKEYPLSCTFNSVNFNPTQQTVYHGRYQQL